MENNTRKTTKEFISKRLKKIANDIYNYNFVPIKLTVLQLRKKMFYSVCFYQLLYIFMFFLIILFTFLYIQYNLSNLNNIGEELKTIKEKFDNTGTLVQLPEHLKLIVNNNNDGTNHFIYGFLVKIIIAGGICLFLLCIISSSLNLYLWRRLISKQYTLKTFKRFMIHNLMWNSIWIILFFSLFTLFKLDFAIKLSMLLFLFYLLITVVFKVTFDEQKNFLENIAVIFSLIVKKFHFFIFLNIFIVLLILAFGIISYLPLIIFKEFQQFIGTSIFFIIFIISFIFIKSYSALSIYRWYEDNNKNNSNNNSSNNDNKKVSPNV